MRTRRPFEGACGFGGQTSIIVDSQSEACAHANVRANRCPRPQRVFMMVPPFCKLRARSHPKLDFNAAMRPRRASRATANRRDFGKSRWPLRLEPYTKFHFETSRNVSYWPDPLEFRLNATAARQRSDGRWRICGAGAGGWGVEVAPGMSDPEARWRRGGDPVAFRQGSGRPSPARCADTRSTWTTARSIATAACGALRRDVPDARSGKSQQIQINKFWRWFLSKRRPALLVHQRLAQLWQKRHQRIVIVKTKLVIVIFGALVLMANGANAEHRNHSHGYARGETPQYQSSGDVYESFSEGHQPYANPDRELYVNRTCCNWKSPHRPIAN
jgi:hypothetical protein